MEQPDTSETSTSREGGFVESYLLYQLAATSHLFSQEFHKHVKEQGIKVHVWRVLACLIDREGLMLTELAKLVLYEQSRLTKIIDQMAGEGLVSKKTVASDRRKTSIFITEKGREIVKPLLLKAKDHEDYILEGLSETERTDLKSLLGKLTQRINADQ